MYERMTGGVARFLLVPGFCLVITSLGGCAGLFGQSSSIIQTKPLLVYQASDTDGILSCLAETSTWSRKQVREDYERVSREDAGSKEATLRRLCLGMHPQATYPQFKESLVLLQGVAHDLKQGGTATHGLLVVVERLHQALIDKWNVYNRLIDEKKALEKELALAQGAEQEARQGDKRRIAELENQVQQLKNIEKIIKNRELDGRGATENE